MILSIVFFLGLFLASIFPIISCLWTHRCDSDFVLIATLDGNVSAVDIESRNVRWSKSTGGPIYTSYQANFVNDGKVYDTYVDCGEDGILYRYQRGSGTILERMENIEDFYNRTISSPKTGSWVAELSFKNGHIVTVDAMLGSLKVRKRSNERIDIQRTNYNFYAMDGFGRFHWNLTVADFNATPYFSNNRPDCCRNQRKVFRTFRGLQNISGSLPSEESIEFSHDLNKMIYLTLTSIVGLIVGISCRTAVLTNKPKKRIRRNKPKESNTNTNSQATEITVGSLSVGPTAISLGRFGTSVFQGKYGSTDVAVKRLPKACNEVDTSSIQRLIHSDRRSNIVRVHCLEQDPSYVYLAMDRCLFSIDHLIDFSPDGHTTVELAGANTLVQDITLWTSPNVPSPHLLNLIRDVASGLAYLHRCGIIHGNLKPSNILIDKFFSANISDAGITRIAPEDVPEGVSDVDVHVDDKVQGNTNYGWRSPECIEKSEKSMASDMFAFGLLVYFLITNGHHPFGNIDDKDLETKVIQDKKDLSSLSHFAEGMDLISSLLHPDSSHRLTAPEVLAHPIFWDSEKKINFLRLVFDKLKAELPTSPIIIDLESTASKVIGGVDWQCKLDPVFLSKLKNYNFSTLLDLLRAIRNKLAHFHEDGDLIQLFGTQYAGFDAYFMSKFPYLVSEVYRSTRKHLAQEPDFKSYFYP